MWFLPHVCSIVRSRLDIFSVSRSADPCSYTDRATKALYDCPLYLKTVVKTVICCLEVEVFVELDHFSHPENIATFGRHIARSFLRLLAFLRDLFEGAPVTVQLGFLSIKRLPALHDHVYVLRIEFDTAADTLSEFCGGERRTTP